MSFLGTNASIYSDIALIIQILSFILISYGVFYAKKLNFSKHIKATNTAVSISIIAVIWMIYSLSLIFSNIDLIMGVHVIFGLAAIISGILFVTNKFIKKAKIQMRSVFMLWLIALLLGITQYYLYYF